MIKTEILDHSPPTVEMEDLPDGGAWLSMRKEIKEVQTPDLDGMIRSKCWECLLAKCRLTEEQAAGETAETIGAAFEKWWDFAANWGGESGRTLEERVADLEASGAASVYKELAAAVRSGVNQV